MSRARVARRIAAAAAYGGGGLGLLGVGCAGLLLTEAKVAARRLTILDGEPPRADGLYGAAFALGEREDEPELAPLRLCMVGDSTAAGFGVEYAKDTPGAVLASALASIAERPVELVNVALNGARSTDLERQVTQLLELVPAPDATLVFIGANDITHATRAADSVRRLGDAVRRLRAAGSHVVVGTCPDLGTIEPVWQPLRWLAQRASRQLAAAQTIVTVEHGGRTVSLGDLLGAEFAGRPEMFASDRYHPSAQGYETAAMAVLPTLAGSLGLWPEEEPEVWRVAPSVLPVAQAAAEAAAHSGTEVAAVAVAGEESGPRGRWAALRRPRLQLRLGQLPNLPNLPRPNLPNLQNLPRPNLVIPPLPNLPGLARLRAGTARADTSADDGSAAEAAPGGPGGAEAGGGAVSTSSSSHVEGGDGGDTSR